MNGLIIYGPDGTSHRASDTEQAAFDGWSKKRESELLVRLALRIADAVATAKMHKAFRDKGLVQPHTRSTFAWRMRERPYSAVRFESFVARKDKYGNIIPPMLDWKDWDFAAPGEGTTWRLSPRLRISNIEVFDVWVVTQLPSGKKRRKLMRADFKSMCESAHCERESCALCWAGRTLMLKDNEIIKIERREGKLNVVDPSGVNPHGKQNSKAQDMGEDQRAPYQLTSTIHAHKKGASEW